MGQFKPMVRMKTTEPSVVLKLKKGGSATFEKLKKMGSSDGFKPMKKAMGGAMDALAREPMPTTPMGNPEAAKAMATRRLAKRAATPMPRGVPAVGKPKPPPMMAPMASATAPRMMKNGGESKAEHKAEMKKMTGTEAKLKKHASLPASKAHRGLKTGGVAKAPAGYKTGGVVQGDAGYKTGGVVNGQGGFKRGGSAKKPSATGAKPDSGAPVAMPQGRKPPSRPVQITQLSGTFKTGGRAKKAIGGVC